MKTSINLNYKTLPKQLRRLFARYRRYNLIIFIVVLVGLYGFLIMQISNASQNEPSQTQISEQMTAVKRLRLDQDSINKIEQLEDQNVTVQSLFQTARENPFQE